MKRISSAKNPHIKHLKGLQEKSRLRSQTKTFSVEGEKEIRFAQEGGYVIRELFFKEDQLEYFSSWVEKHEANAHCYAIQEDVFESLCYRSNTSKVIAVVEQKSGALEDLVIKENPFFLVAESPEKPGNIGALLRTADAVGADALLIVDPKTDLYNPNVVRSSVGCIFSVQWLGCARQDFFDFLIKYNIKLVSAALTTDAVAYTQLDYTGPLAIAVGTEDKGLSEDWVKQSPAQVFIPMMGKNDSLNVSVAAGILMYEAQRQRKLG